MIAHLRGRILEKQPTRVVVEAGGVGYDVAVPLSTFYGLGEPGADVALRVHTHVREDALALYGFATALELDLFDRLISISGIGPKLALAVLSGIEPPDLVARDRARRSRAAHGDSRRRQEDVRAHRARVEGSAAARPRRGGGWRHRARGEPACATICSPRSMNLGYHRPLAEKAVDASLKAIGRDAGFERTLKQALREVAK